MKRIKAIYRTVHGDLRVAHRMKNARIVFVQTGNGRGYTAYVWTVGNQRMTVPDNAWPSGTKFITEEVMFETFITKLQQLGQAAKNVLLFILAPIFLVAGAFFWLFSKNRALQDQVNTLKSQQGVIKDETKDAEVTKQATTSLADYRSLRDEYLAAQKKPSDPSKPSS